jgi:hypothetical protein
MVLVGRKPELDAESSSDSSLGSSGFDDVRTTMDRRQILQLGAALTTLPLTGCGASAPMPQPAPTTGTAPPAGEKAAVVTPEPAATAENSAPPPEDKGADAAAADAKEEPPKVSFTRVIGKVGRNHGHVLTVTLADVMAGAEKTYDLKGKSGHTHAVTLSADDMKSLQEGKIVRTKSTTHGHAHYVLVRCAPAEDPPDWVSVVRFSSSGKDEHEIVVTAADMAAKVEKTYDLQGLTGHNHQVTLTTADFEHLLKGGPVTRPTTRTPGDTHLHTVTIEYRVKKATT